MDQRLSDSGGGGDKFGSARRKWAERELDRKERARYISAIHTISARLHATRLIQSRTA